MNIFQGLKDRRRAREANSENVYHPSHYNQGKFEVIDVIEDWKLDFCLGNAIKYIARAPHKGEQIRDLEKAIEYLKLKVERLLQGARDNESDPALRQDVEP